MRSKISFLIAALSLLFAGVYWWSQRTYPLEISYVPDLTDAYISESEYARLYDIRQDCFRELLKDQRRKYFIEVKGMEDGPRLDRYMQSYTTRNDLSLRSNLRYTKNVYLAREQGELVGFFNCTDENTITENSVMVWSVCVASPKRGQGRGAKMMRHAIEHCRKPGRALSLVVFKGHPHLIKFYNDLGFRVVSPQREVDEGFNYFNKHLMFYEPQATTSSP